MECVIPEARNEKAPQLARLKNVFVQKRKSTSRLLMMSIYIARPRRKHASSINTAIHFFICNPLIASFYVIDKHQSVQMIM
jgi:hypothetical protein